MNGVGEYPLTMLHHTVLFELKRKIPIQPWDLGHFWIGHIRMLGISLTYYKCYLDIGTMTLERVPHSLDQEITLRFQKHSMMQPSERVFYLTYFSRMYYNFGNNWSSICSVSWKTHLSVTSITLLNSQIHI